MAQLQSLHRDCNALADTDTHRAKRKTALRTLQLIHCGRHQTRAAHAERVVECNRAAIRIHASVVVGHAECAQHRDALRSERLIQFDQSN